jgi:hypothetical protein
MGRWQQTEIESIVLASFMFPVVSGDIEKSDGIEAMGGPSLLMNQPHALLLDSELAKKKNLATGRNRWDHEPWPDYVQEKYAQYLPKSG